MQADSDNNDCIDFNEFIAGAMNLNREQREGDILRAFAYFDKDNNGSLSMEEVQQVCAEYNFGTRAEIGALVEEADHNQVGREADRNATLFKFLHKLSSICVGWDDRPQRVHGHDCRENAKFWNGDHSPIALESM